MTLLIKCDNVCLYDACSCVSERERIPASVLRLQHVQQKLLDVARGELVDVLGWHVSCHDLQFMFHSLDNPSGSPHNTHVLLSMVALSPAQLTSI